MAGSELIWYVQVTILWTVKTKPCSLFIPFWQDNLAHLQCPYSELFWSAFSRIRTEYGEITPNTDTFHAVLAGRENRCAFPKLMSFHISTDILLNISLTTLL